MRHNTRYALILALSTLSLTACPWDNSHEGASLECEATRSELTLDQASNLGFTGAELLANVVGSYAAELTWNNPETGEPASTTALTVGLSSDATSVTFVDLEMKEGEGGEQYATDAMPMCEDSLEVKATLTFVSADGAFDESWQVTLAASEVNRGSFRVEFMPDDLNGTYDFIGIDPAEFDEVYATVDGILGQGYASGGVYEFGTKVEGEVASATQGEVARWETVTDQQQTESTP